MSESRQVVLVVDDTPENIDVLSGVLRPEYRVKAALNGERALRIASAEPQPNIILLDIMMPGIDGYEVCRRLKADARTKGIPVIFVTAKVGTEDEAKGFELGAVDYITKPISPPIVQARVRNHLALYDQNQQLERKVAQRTRELRESRQQIIRRLSRAAEFRDNHTGLHIVRMSHYSRLIAEEANLGSSWCDLLFNAAPMHDIGKIGIPDHILLKPGKLDQDEWRIMSQHPVYGAEIIGKHKAELMQFSRIIALSHHERWDGSGYPQGLAGETIPLAGRIVAIADVFDALTSVRSYKPAWSEQDAIAWIEGAAGQHFDPRLVALFLRVLPRVSKIKRRFTDERD